MESFFGRQLENLRGRIAGRLMLVVIIGAVIGMVAWVSHVRTQPPQSQLMEGQVVALGGFTNEQGYDRYIDVRISGITLQLVAPRDLVAQCSVGDRIAVFPVGKSYHVALQGCAVDRNPKP